MTYFDWTATAPMSPKAIEAYTDAATNYIGNPSSTHPLGTEAKERLEKEREAVATLLKTKAQNIYFTCGGTESNAIVLSSLLNSPSPGEIVTTGIEHAAILEWKKALESHGWKFTALRCPGGYLDPQALKEALNPKVRMVAFMKVNNVAGTVLDTQALVRVVRDYEKTAGRAIHIHCDAVQALGKIPFFPELEDMDSAAFSAHKFRGPRGVGILYNRNKALSALSRGGGQEKGLRAGTENLAG
ncbi:MAG: aminotransferase class V-fold PLP-dependent enzyme, partial [Spirochaetales bacterium]|nr:aminotransferase class V-fold PLP-dependent enzyme [Spirochaetales bacterium]